MRQNKLWLLLTTNYLPAMPSAKLMQAGKLQTRRKAFTLIELLIVVAIIGILATIVIIRLTSAKDSSRYARVVSDMTSIAKAVKAYEVDHNNVYPGDGSYKDLPTGANLKLTGSGGWLSAYLPSWPDTPCGDDYGYEYNNWKADGTGVDATSLNPAISDGHIAIHFRYRLISGGTTVSRWLYYFDVRNFDAVTSASGGLSKGLNILNISPQEITCHE